MNKIRSATVSFLALLALLVLILDAKTASIGAYKGIQLCITNFIPSILPFIILTKLICLNSTYNCVRLFGPIEKLAGIPSGAGKIMLLGFIGGYPLGAQCIEDAYNCGELKLHDAKRMLGFCSNAGPAFIFGVLSPMFDSLLIPIYLMIIHISSAIIVSVILPRKAVGACTAVNKQTTSFAEIVESSVRSVSIISCWIVLFRVILEFMNKWFMYNIPSCFKVFIFGILELTNGIFMLKEISHVGTMFILSSFMLGFGGLCVGLQTISCTKRTGLGLYFPGKVLQGLLSVLLAYLAHFFVLPQKDHLYISHMQTAFLLMVITVFCIFLRTRKKVVAFT